MDFRMKLCLVLCFLALTDAQNDTETVTATPATTEAPIDGTLGSWSGYGSCEPECGPGRVQKRNRTCSGNRCLGDLVEERVCTGLVCVQVVENGVSIKVTTSLSGQEYEIIKADVENAVGNFIEAFCLVDGNNIAKCCDTNENLAKPRVAQFLEKIYADFWSDRKRIDVTATFDDESDVCTTTTSTPIARRKRAIVYMTQAVLLEIFTFNDTLTKIENDVKQIIIDNGIVANFSIVEAVAAEQFTTPSAAPSTTTGMMTTITTTTAAAAGVEAWVIAVAVVGALVGLAVIIIIVVVLVKRSQKVAPEEDTTNDANGGSGNDQPEA